MTELLFIFIGGCFLMVSIILFIELSFIYKRNSKENTHYHKVQTSSGVKWFKDEQLIPEVKAYKGFYSFSHTYLNKMYDKGEKKPSKHIHIVSGDDILKRGENGSQGLKRG